MKHLFSAPFLKIAVGSSLAIALAAISGCSNSSTTTTTTVINTPPPVDTETNQCTGTDTTSPAQPTPTANYPGTPFTGTVMAGLQPLIGAKVQLYATGTTGNGSAGTALLTTPLTTSANGTFTVPAYVCPESNSVLYAIATGGATSTSSPSNTATELAAVIGSCNSLSSTPTFTINEATTVATAYAMSPFLAVGGKIGSTATNTSGITLAANTAANLVNTTTGVAPGINFPSTGTAPTAKLNSLANALNACITATGGFAATACTQLETATTRATVVPTNTLDAVTNLAKQPGGSIGTIYTLSGGASTYTPSLSTAPDDWMLYATYAGGGMNDPSALSIDSLGNIWVANYFNVVSAFSNTGVPIEANGYTDYYLNTSYGGAVNVNNTFWATDEEGPPTGLGSVDPFTIKGATGAFAAGYVNFPLAVAFDTSGMGWVVDYGNSSVSLFTPTYTALSGLSGYQSSHLVFPVAVATDADCNAYVANQSSNTVTRVSADGKTFTDFVVGNSSSGVGPSGVAIDNAGNVWSANYYGNSVGLITGSDTVASGDGFTGGGINHPQGIAADGAGNVWVANYRGIGMSELAGASAASPGAALSPSSGWGADAGLLEPFALAIDAGGSVWISNFGTNTITEFIGVAAPVQTPLLGPVRIP